MKIQSLALAVTAYLSSAAAQGMSGLPSCAVSRTPVPIYNDLENCKFLTKQQQSCATDAIPSACSLIDVKCICKTKSFVDDMACCVGKSCDSKDQDSMS